jgi:hypothetical protein
MDYSTEESPLKQEGEQKTQEPGKYQTDKN